MTAEERRVWQKAYRLKNSNGCTKKYEKTPKGFLMRLYRNMTSRILGIQKEKFHLYEGKSLLDKETFYSWAVDHPDFISMFTLYKDSGYVQKLAPTVDRIESSLGYEISNMQWLTHSENSRKGANSRYGKSN